MIVRLTDVYDELHNMHDALKATNVYLAIIMILVAVIAGIILVSAVTIVTKR
jgi:hypothetical protein